MGNRPFGRSRFRWEDNIKRDVKTKRCGLDTLDLTATEIRYHGERPSDCFEWLSNYELLKNFSDP